MSPEQIEELRLVFETRLYERKGFQYSGRHEMFAKFEGDRYMREAVQMAWEDAKYFADLYYRSGRADALSSQPLERSVDDYPRNGLLNDAVVKVSQ
jgi:hypothetical protein